MPITVVGNTVRLTPAAAVTANVGNVATRTNTFHVLNSSATVYVYVGVFSNYADAAAMNHPFTGGVGGGVPLAPNESMTFVGNFGTSLLATQANVYVSAITYSGTTNAMFTPVAPGSEN